MKDVIDNLSRTIRDAAAHKRPLCIRGGGTKEFYGGEIRGHALDTTALRGIVSYEPTKERPDLMRLTQAVNKHTEYCKKKSET